MSDRQQATVPASPAPRASRSFRAARLAFRIMRNGLALLGVFFVYLFWHGYQAYDAAAPDGPRAIACDQPSRCM